MQIKVYHLDLLMPVFSGQICIHMQKGIHLVPHTHPQPHQTKFTHLSIFYKGRKADALLIGSQAALRLMGDCSLSVGGDGSMYQSMK